MGSIADIEKVLAVMNNFGIVDMTDEEIINWSKQIKSQLEIPRYLGDCCITGKELTSLQGLPNNVNDGGQVIFDFGYGSKFDNAMVYNNEAKNTGFEQRRFYISDEGFNILRTMFPALNEVNEYE